MIPFWRGGIYRQRCGTKSKRNILKGQYGMDPCWNGLLFGSVLLKRAQTVILESSGK